MMKNYIVVNNERIVVKRLHVFDEDFIQKSHTLFNDPDDLEDHWEANLPAMKFEARISINNSPFISYRLEVDHAYDQIHIQPERYELRMLCDKYSNDSGNITLDAIDDHFDDEIYERLVINE